MSRKDKNSRNPYFHSKQDAAETKFDEAGDEYTAMLAEPPKKKAESASKTALPEFEDEEDEENTGSRFVFWRKTGTFLWTVPSFFLLGIVHSAKWVTAKSFSLLTSWKAFLKREQEEELPEEKGVPAAVRIPKKNLSVMDIAEMPLNYKEEDEDGLYFGNWLKIAGKTAMFAASVVLLTGLYFGGKALYQTCKDGSGKPEIAETQPQAEQTEKNETKTSEPDLLAQLINKPAETPEPKPAAANPLVASNAAKKPAKTPEPKPAAINPLVASNAAKKPETAVSGSLTEDPFKKTAKSEPKTAKPEPKNPWLTETKPEETAAKSVAEPFALTAADSKTPVKEEKKTEPPKTETAKQTGTPVASDLWGAVAAVPDVPASERNTSEKGFAPITENESSAADKNKPKDTLAELTPLAPMKKIETANADSPSPLKPLKTVGNTEIVASRTPAIPKTEPAAGTFKTPSVPPVMNPAVADAALNSIPPAVPLPEKLPEIIPAIPKTGNIQTFAALNDKEKKKEKGLGIPADDTVSAGAVKFQPSPQNQTAPSPPLEVAASPFTAPMPSTGPSIPKDGTLPQTSSLAMSVPATLPQHWELAKMEPLIGSQLQNEVLERRNQESAGLKLNFGDAKTGAVRYSPKSVSSETLAMSAASAPKMLEFTPIPMPESPDNPNSNALLPLLPSGHLPSVPPSLPPLSAAPQAMIAPVNPGYRRSAESEAVSSEPAVMPPETEALTADSKAVSFRQKLDQEITKTPAATETYTVQPGDSYYTICERFFDTGLLFRALAEHNRQRFGTGYTPQPGTMIEVPTADYLKTNYAEALLRSRRRQTSIAEPAITQNPPSGQRYIVQEGDTVFGIATNILRDTPKWKEIVALNSDRIPNPRQYLQPGTELILPRSAY